MSWGHALWIVPAAVVGYGFYDASATRRVDPASIDLRAYAAGVDQLYFDSMSPYILSDGDAFVRLTWTPPADARVRHISLSGEAFLGASLGAFSSPCQRRGSTDLGSAPKLRPDGTSTENNDPVCFLKLPTRLPFRANADGRPIDDVERNRVLQVVQSIDLRNLQATVEVSNRPMRYVSWIIERFDALRGWLAAPFERV